MIFFEMPNANLAIKQIDAVENECNQMLQDIQALCPADSAGNRPDIFRLMAVPMIYSAWERAFRITTAVAIRFSVESVPTAGQLAPEQRALVLQKEPFFQSFMEKSKSSKGVRGPRKSEFEALSEFLAKFEKWAQSKTGTGIDPEEYVMTFSNVDHLVLRLHERVLGVGPTIEKTSGQPLDLAPLGELLNRRNDISHGGSIQPPGERNLNSLFIFTETLITSYCDSMRRLIARRNHGALSRFRGYQLYLHRRNRKR